MNVHRSSHWMRRLAALAVVLPLATAGIIAVGAGKASATGPHLTGAPVDSGIVGGGGMNPFVGLPWADPPGSGCPSTLKGASIVKIPGGSGFTATAAIKVSIDGKTAKMTGTPKTTSLGKFTTVKFDVPCTVPGPATYPVTVTAGASSATYGTTSTKPTGSFNELSVNSGKCPTTLTIPKVSTTTNKSEGMIHETTIFYSGKPQGTTPTFTTPKTGKAYTIYFMDDTAIGTKGTPDFPAVYINGKLIRLTNTDLTIITDDGGAAVTGKHIIYPLEPVTDCGGSPGYLTSTQTYTPDSGHEPMPGGSHYTPPTTHMVYLNEAAVTFTPGKMKAVTGTTPKLTKAKNTIELYMPDGDGDAGAYEWTTILGGTPDLVVSKSVSPASGTNVQPTQTLTYTLTFSNTGGNFQAAVTYTDYLSDILDDASIVTGPTVTGSGLSVSPVTATAKTFTVTGTVPAGKADKVTYTAKVDKAATDSGSHVLNNFLEPTTTKPPTSCTSTNTLCTTNPVPAIAIKKTATPVTVTSVGQTVTYAFTVTNTGGTTLSAVSVTDAFTPPSTKDSLATAIKCVPATTTGTCTTSDQTAKLGPGKKATFKVTYKATKADLDHGVINNSATASGTAHTAVDHTMTTHVVSAPSTATVHTADLVVTKDVSPVSRKNVFPGHTLTYTLTFANTDGTVPAPVAYTDDLSDVTDDATVTSTPKEGTGSSGLSVGSITATGKHFTITGTVPAGKTDTVTYTVKVDTAATDSGSHVLNNYLVPTGTAPPSSCAITNTDCTTNPVPAITIKKTATPTAVTAAGQKVTYNFVVTDTGGTSLSDVKVTDAFTSPSTSDTVTTTSIVCQSASATSSCTSTTTANLAVGGHATFSVDYHVSTTDLANGVINNSSTASGTAQTAFDLTDFTKVVSTPSTASVPAADLQVTKKVTPGSGTNVHPGDTLTYTLTFSNVDGQASAPVSYTDTLKGVLDDATVTTPPHEATGSGLAVGSISSGAFTITGSVAGGKSATVVYKVKVDTASGDSGNHLVTNFLLPTGTPTPTTCVAQSPVCTTNPVPAITIVKTATPTEVTKAGQIVTYAFTVTNTGGTPLDGVTVTDKFTAPSTGDSLGGPIECDKLMTPKGTCTGTTTDLAVGQSARFVVTYRVTATDLPNGVINNSATASGTPPASQTSVVSTPSVASVKTADLMVTKSVSPQSGSNALPGEVLSYTLTFDNSKGTTGAPVTYTDTLKGVLDDATVTTAPALASGSGLTVGSITATAFKVTGTVPAGTSDTVTYKVTLKGARSDTGNHLVTDYLVLTGTPTPTSCTTSILCTTNPIPAITIVKTATPNEVTKAGQTVTYSFTVTNTGARPLDTVSVTDAFTSPSTVDSLSSPIDCTKKSNPKGTCTGTTTTLEVGQSATFQATYTVTATDLPNGVINNSATASGHPPESQTEVVSTPSTASVKTADLVVSKSVTPASGSDVHPGEVLNYTLTFDNSLGTAPGPLSYTDTLKGVLDDAAVTVTPSVTPATSLTLSKITDGKFTVTGSVAGGTTDTVTYKVRVDGAASDTGNHLVTDYLVPEGTPTPTRCTTESNLCTTNPVPAISIVKTATRAVVTKAAQVVTYSFDVTDSGATALDGVSVTDAFTSPSTKDVLSSPIDCTVTKTPTGTCSGTAVDLVPGESATFTATYAVSAADLGNGVVDNSATASGTPPELQTKVVSTPSLAAVKAADLIATKAVTPASGTPVKAGQILTYTLTFANTDGTAPAPVAYTDTLKGVLDDASVTATPKLATGSDLTVGALTGSAFTVGGTVPAGTKDTVTYQVTVKSQSGDTGNHLVTDYLVPTGTTPSTSCTSTNSDCTTNPVPALTLTKSATPTVVTRVGQTIAYTFVATNTGATALDGVSVTDTFTAPSTKDTLTSAIDCTSTANPAGTCSGTSVDLAEGQSATFTATYAVASADLSNQAIDNSATASGTPPGSKTAVVSPPATASVTVTKKSAGASASTTPTTQSPSQGGLASTGAPLAREVLGGLALLALGSGLVLFALRRRRRTI